MRTKLGWQVTWMLCTAVVTWVLSACGPPIRVDPTAIPVYPGAQMLSDVQTDSDIREIALETGDPPSKVLQWYRDALADGRWTFTYDDQDGSGFSYRGIGVSDNCGYALSLGARASEAEPTHIKIRVLRDCRR